MCGRFTNRLTWREMIITNANDLAAKVHDRMPALLQQKDFDRWLAGTAGNHPMTIRLQASVQSLVFVIMLAATLFGTAGRCDIIEFWVYIAIVQMQTGYPALLPEVPA
jgi:hypothetical protein